MKKLGITMTTAVMTALSITVCISAGAAVDHSTNGVAVTSTANGLAATYDLRVQKDVEHDDWEWLAPNRKWYV